ncbi:MAG: DsbA family protein [Candidatus Peribacteraceae bacterium]
MRLPFITLTLSLVLVACVDTTGLSAESSRPLKGNPSALVLVQEFADLQCPACKAAHEQINGALLEQYGDSIRLEFMHFPLRGIHPYAMEAAEAAECAADQGKFWEFVDMNYANQSSLKSAALREWGAALKLDSALFDRCIESDIKEDTILADYAEGQKMGVNGTPSYYVNGKKVGSSVEELGAAIDAAATEAAAVPL